jgi:anti-sigma regulatory factor (Ser/Thr protein kinase)
MSTFELQLEPDRSNVAVARRFVMDAVHRLGRDAAADVAELLTSEVVTNAVLHAGTAVQLRVLGAEGGVRIEVTDGTVGAPTRRHYSAEAATGRGLGLVEALASAWGTRPEGDGKTVWFTVAAEDAA